jgi:hypothetical protein
MAPARVQADQDGAAVAPKGEIYAAPGAGWGAGEGGGIGAESGEGALPCGVGRVRPVLQAAPATGAEMRTRRLGTVGAGRDDLGRARPAVAAARNGQGTDLLARQRERKIGCPPVREAGDAIAVEADALDACVLWRRLGLSRRRR